MNFLTKLTPREKRLLLLMAVVFVFVGAYYAIQFYKKNFGQIDQKITTALSDQNQLLELKKSFEMLEEPVAENANLDNMETKVIQLLEKYELRDKAGKIAPTLGMVDNNTYERKSIVIRIQESIALPVISFVKEVELSPVKPMIKIESFSSRESVKTPGQYTFSIMLSAYMQKK